MLPVFSFAIKFVNFEKKIVQQLQEGEVNAIKHQKNDFLVSGFDDWFVRLIWCPKFVGK